MHVRTGIAVAIMAAASIGAWAALKPPPITPPLASSGPRSPKLVPPVGLQPPASLLVQGRVPGASGVATLVLRVGETTATQAVALPDFSFTVPGAAPDAMVSIEVETPGVKRASILGSFRLLSRQAGRDAVLAADETDRVTLRPLLTALELYVRMELGARLPVSDAEHERAVRSVPVDVPLGASLLASLEAGSLVLPTGYSHGYALMADGPRFRQYVRDNPAVTAGYSDAAGSASGIPMTPEAVPSQLALIGDSVYGDVQIVERGTSIVLRVPGGFEIHDNFPSRRSPKFSVEMADGGLLQLVPDQPVYYNTRVFKQFQNGSAEVLARYTLESIAYRRQFVGGRSSLWSVRELYTVTYPQHPELPAEAVGGWELMTAIPLDTQARRFGTVDIVGRRGLPRFCLAPDVAGEDVIFACGYSQYAFAPNGTGVIEDGSPTIDIEMRPRSPETSLPVDWAIVNRGAMEVTDGAIVTRAWLIERGEAVASIVYVASSGSGSARLTVAGQSALIDGTLRPSYGPADVVGTWRFATAEQQRGVQEIFNGPTDYRFVRSADGIALQTFRQPEIQAGASVGRAGWTLSGGRFYSTRYSANVAQVGPQGFTSCSEALSLGATLCRVAEVRDFLPLAHVGNRFYGIENLHRNIAGYGVAPVIDTIPRATYLELVDDEDVDSRPIAPMSTPRGRTSPPR